RGSPLQTVWGKPRRNSSRCVKGVGLQAGNEPDPEPARTSHAGIILERNCRTPPVRWGFVYDSNYTVFTNMSAHPPHEPEHDRGQLPPRLAALRDRTATYARRGYAEVRQYAREQYARNRERLVDRSTRGATIGLLAAAGLLTLLLGYWIVLILITPSVGQLEETQMAEATIAYTADGQELTR